LTVKMKVSPEPSSQEKLISLMQRYRDALNYSIRKIIENKALSLSKAHKLLYSNLKDRFDLPSRIAQDCYREALTIAKSWLRNQNKGETPKAKNLRIWLTYNQSYRVNEEYVEILGGVKLKIVGWDRRYDSYPNREARLVFRDDKFILYIYKCIPKPAKYIPKSILAMDVNEKHIVVGNSKIEYRFETAVEKAIRYKRLVENLQKKYSSTRYNGWIRRKNIRKRIKNFHKKARDILEDWIKKISYKITMLAKQNQYAVAREDLTGLIENLRKLSKNHKVGLIILSYRKLEFWSNWQAEKHGVPIVIIEPNGTSSICPKCGSKLKEKGHRVMKCLKCGFEADRDTIALLNIGKKALSKIGGSLTTPTASQMTDVAPNRCEEPPRSSENPRLLGRGGGQMKEILAYIINSQATPVSWLNISKETSIASPHTTQAYVEDLKNLFVVEILNFLSPESKIIQRKNKKIHITDPFLYETICEFAKAEAHELSLLEAVVATHLSRKYETFYWKNKHEVDIVVRLNKKQIGIEVKKIGRSWEKPRHLEKTFLLTKDDIPLFLASINV